MDAAELDRRARTGGGWIPQPLVALLMELGHLEVVQREAEEGDWFCARAWSGSLAQQGFHESALTVIAPFAKSGWWPAIDQLADLLTLLGRFNEIVALIQSYLESIAPCYQNFAIDRLARTLARLGRHDEAFGVLEPYTTNRFLMATLATTLAGCGLDDKILTVLDDAIANPVEVHAVRLLANLYEQQEQPDKAISLLKFRIEISGTHYANHIGQLAEILVRRGRFAELRQYPIPHRDDEAARQLAKAYWKAGDLDAAEEALRPFIDMHPSAAILLAEMLTSIDRVEEAIEVLLPHALADGGEYYCAAPTLVELLANHGRLEEALAFLDRIAGPGITPFELLKPRADLLYALGRGQEALHTLQAHPEIDCLYGRTCSAQLLRDLGRVDEAIALLDSPDHRSNLQLEMLIQQGRVDEAVDRVHTWPPPPPIARSHTIAPPF